MAFRLLLILSLFLNITTVSLSAQTTKQEEAMQYFGQGDYVQALPLFKQLVTLFPKDPRYQYYAGACLVQTNSCLVQAIGYLKFAADENVPRDVYYFLGEANLLLYRYDEALDAFLEFQQFGDRASKERWQCDMDIAMARNGKLQLEKQRLFSVYRIDTIKAEDLWKFYNAFMKNGKFGEIREKSFSLFQSRPKYSWGFIPALTDRGQPVFESSVVGITNKNRDLFSVHKSTENEWGYPENLGNVINSPYDEDYAYFNASESTLYFSSKGHNSMGGYDIFKSVYDPDTRTWGTPVNLGFPINSPYDDFLFVPSDDQTKACFASNRETHGDTLIIYTISFSPNYQSTTLSMPDDYISRSHLRPSAPGEAPITTLPVPSYANSVSQRMAGAYPDELLNHEEYNGLINSAMAYQLQSDSMGRLIEGLQGQLPLAKTGSDRDKLNKVIYSLEKRSKEAQHKADDFYEKARAVEKQYSENNQQRELSPDADRNLVKSAFSKKEQQVQPDNMPANNDQYSKKRPLPVAKAKKNIYAFKVVANSPYQSIGQIPINPPLPDGLIYRIQIGAFSKPVEPDRFKGITPISAELLQNGITKYYAGFFSRLTDAEKALNKVHEEGLKDAYVVAFYNGKSIPSNRAKELEKELQ